jgi:amidase
MMNSKPLTPLLALASFVFSFSALAAESFPPNYDESADLAELAQLENESMHYQLIQSRVRDKPLLWQPVAAQLDEFSRTDYEALKPLILDRSIAQLQAAVSAGQLSYRQLTGFYLWRIREIESDSTHFINGVIALNGDALTRAAQLDAQREAGRAVGSNSLFGIPVLLKDNIGAAGMPTTAGAVALANNYTNNAFITERLLASGAIILGKANLSEWAYFFCDGCPSGYSALGGQTLNPYGRLVFGTGGSSAGSGAAVAANFAAVAVGSETSGSILSPSSANSLVGLKPTTGSLSRTGIVPISATLDTAGPMAKTVADAVALFNGMAGYDSADLAMPLLTENFQLEVRQISLRGKRLGVINSYREDDALYAAGVAAMAGAGAELVELDFPRPTLSNFDEFLGAEMVRDLALYLENHAGVNAAIDSINTLQDFNSEDLDTRAPYGQALVDMMAELDYSADQIESLRMALQDQASELMAEVFAANDLDVLVTLNNRNAGVAALANYPALTVPAGYGENGRPAGVTFIAPSFEEQDLIDIGLQFEQLTNARRAPVGYQ